jgi:hypothetical protein
VVGEANLALMLVLVPSPKVFTGSIEGAAGGRAPVPIEIARLVVALSGKFVSLSVADTWMFWAALEIPVAFTRMVAVAGLVPVVISVAQDGRLLVEKVKV